MTPDDGNAARAIAPDDIEQAELDQAEYDELVSLRPHERRALEVLRGHAFLLARGFVEHSDARGAFKHYCTETWCPDREQ